MTTPEQTLPTPEARTIISQETHQIFPGGMEIPAEQLRDLPVLESGERLGVLGDVVGAIEVNQGYGGSRLLVRSGDTVSVVTVTSREGSEAPSVTVEPLAADTDVSFGVSDEGCPVSTLRVALNADGGLRVGYQHYGDMEASSPSGITFGREQQVLPVPKQSPRTGRSDQVLYAGDGRYVRGRVVSGHPVHGPALVQTSAGIMGIRQPKHD